MDRENHSIRDSLRECFDEMHDRLNEAYRQLDKRRDLKLQNTRRRIQEFQDRERDVLENERRLADRRDELQRSQAENKTLRSLLSQLRGRFEERSGELANLKSRIEYAFHHRIPLDHHLRDLHPDRSGQNGDPEAALEAESDSDEESSTYLGSEPVPDLTIYCDCQMVYEEDGPDMVRCDRGKYCKGKTWYHLNCVGLESAPEEDDLWYCHHCNDKEPTDNSVIYIPSDSEGDDDPSPDKNGPSSARFQGIKRKRNNCDSEDDGDWQNGASNVDDRKDAETKTTKSEASSSQEEGSDAESDYSEGVAGRPSNQRTIAKIGSKDYRTRREKNLEALEKLDPEKYRSTESMERPQKRRKVVDALQHLESELLTATQNPVNDIDTGDHQGKSTETIWSPKDQFQSEHSDDSDGEGGVRRRWNEEEEKAAMQAMTSAITGENRPSDLKKVTGNKQFQQASEILKRQGIHRNWAGIKKRWNEGGLRERAAVDERLYRNGEIPKKGDVWTGQAYTKRKKVGLKSKREKQGQ